MNDFTPPLSGLPPVSGKAVVAKFDGGLLTSDGGVLLLREIEQRLRVAERLAPAASVIRAIPISSPTRSPISFAFACS